MTCPTAPSSPAARKPGWCTARTSVGGPRPVTRRRCPDRAAASRTYSPRRVCGSCSATAWTPRCPCSIPQPGVINARARQSASLKASSVTHSVEVGLVRRVGQIELQPARPVVAVALLGVVEDETLSVGPVEQVPGGLHQGVRMAGVLDRRITAGRERAGDDLAFGFDEVSRGHPDLDVEQSGHVDHPVAPERRAGRSPTGAASQSKTWSFRGGSTSPSWAMVTWRRMAAYGWAARSTTAGVSRARSWSSRSFVG